MAWALPRIQTNFDSFEPSIGALQARHREATGIDVQVRASGETLDRMAIL